ncbi:uncharacterized protein Ttll5 isoform X3 [Cardiocondyla obscurior]|uniref:uncharacterized protein Ttll5 isoform X3 n=1 Tax=Cardiocondyla obscurior TaxID=286306 RepID=UPI0039657CE5
MVSMNETDFNVLWMGSHPKPDILRNLMSHQKINHFPRSYEITRKDRLYKNIEAMQRSKGFRNLDFIPQTFLLPTETRELISAHFRYRGPWIVKPKASSRGRGIYIVNNPEKILTDESVIVAQYINNPLLVDGHKCDLRLYVAVTNYDPLLIYLYEDGLVRFAAVKYDGRNQYIWNPCMHLCNYSINKFHVDYVKSEDPDAEDVGHKWTLSALLRHLRSMGQDTESLMQRIEDIIIKSILATASGIVSGLKQFVKHPETCFELFGFDILIDDTLKPWLLEVNLTPSLGCDSPLDIRLKSALIADLFTLVGIPAVDPIVRSQNLNRAAVNSYKKINNYRRVQSAETLTHEKKNSNKNVKSKADLNSEQQRIVASAKAQFERRGGFVRIFPSPKSWELYSQYLDPVTGAPMISDPRGPRRLPLHINTNYNLMLHEQLFPAANRIAGYIIPEMTLDRLSRYERYERALVKGHKMSLDRSHNNKENLDIDICKYKSQIMQSMQEGNKLSSGEARKAFSLYLSYILRKISHPNADPGCCDLIMKFLQHSSCSLRTPFLFTLPCNKLSDKDRAAITAKQLSDFLHLYNRETDLYEDTVDRPRTVPHKLFQKFLATASEQDLDDVLILQTRLYKCAHSFLGRSGFAGNLRGANLLGFLPHITSRVYSNAAATEQCRCNNSINRIILAATHGSNGGTGGEQSPPYKITKFENEPGLYFEGQGQLQVTESVWKFVIITDTEAIEARYKNLQSYVTKAEELCENFYKSKEDQIGAKCKEILYTAAAENDKLTVALNRLRIIYGVPVQKKGLIDIIGKVGKSLFGLMDADDEEQITEQLKIIHSRQEALQHVAKTQIKILNTTIGHIKLMEDKVEHHIQILANATSNISWRLDQLTRRLYAIDYLSVLEALIKTMINNVYDVTDFLTHAKADIINLRILPLERLIIELREASGHLKGGNHFPFRVNEQSWNDIQKYAEISAYYKKNAIVTIIKFPIVKYESYEVMRVSPIPVLEKENRFKVVNVNNEVIAFDRDNANYILLTADELKKCRRGNKNYICTQNHPVYRVKANAPCEIQALTRPEQQPTQCDIRQPTSRATFWMTLNEPQAWLFSTINTQEIHMQCKNYPSKILLIERTGKLNVYGECKITTTDMTIRTTTASNETDIITHLPLYNLSLTLANALPEGTNLKEIQRETFIRNPVELDKLSGELSELDNTVSQPGGITSHEIIVYTASASTIVSVIAIIAVIVILGIRRYHKNKKPPPSPRMLKPTTAPAPASV